MKAFIDTNILIDYVCNRDGYVDAARTIFLLGYEKDIQLYIAPLSFINTYYIGKKYNYNRQSLIHSLKEIEKFVTITTTNRNVIYDSLYSSFDDFEDSTQYFSALQSGVDVIITRNTKDFRNSLIKTMTPDEFLVSFNKVC